MDGTLGGSQAGMSMVVGHCISIDQCSVDQWKPRSLSLVVSFSPQIVVERLFPTLFCLLNVAVLGCKASVFPLQSHCLCNESLLAILLGDAAAEEFGWAFNDGTDLRELWKLGFSVFFLVVPFGIQNRAHSQQLQISLELSGQLSLWQVEPFRSSGRFLLSRGGQLVKVHHETSNEIEI